MNNSEIVNKITEGLSNHHTVLSTKVDNYNYRIGIGGLYNQDTFDYCDWRVRLKFNDDNKIEVELIVVNDYESYNVSYSTFEYSEENLSGVIIDFILLEATKYVFSRLHTKAYTIEFQQQITDDLKQHYDNKFNTTEFNNFKIKLDNGNTAIINIGSMCNIVRISNKNHTTYVNVIVNEEYNNSHYVSQHIIDCLDLF